MGTSPHAPKTAGQLNKSISQSYSQLQGFRYGLSDMVNPGLKAQANALEA